ncbi:MAG TPA: hypothetical protein VG245_03485 [Candidatus Dormibacteraeota bacterium]|nr:hypothetical protein [Candidatus Dormibacteraeota bacterium]
MIYEPCPNAFYRAYEPMKAMERRGHEIVWQSSDGKVDARRLATCDVVHVYRRASDDARGVMADLVRSGTPLVYDNDDDFTAVPKESPDYKRVGGLAGERIFVMTVKAARMARCFTTTNDVLAEKYRNAGVQRTEVIGNFLAPDALQPSSRHEGMVIGWVAGIDHQADAARIDIAGALRRVIAKHRDVRVECIGVNLKLTERYRHEAFVPFHELPSRIAGYDMGIAPLADLPGNRARSDIKLKEYAAAGVPWLASPTGPYVGLGEGEGGRLVTDDGWFEALDDLVSHRLTRWWLGRKAQAWARRNTIDAVADRWEALFLEVAGSRAVPASRPGG